MTQTVGLVELAASELTAFIADAQTSYAQDMHESGGIPIEQALAAARESTAELFPDGQPAPGNHVWRALDPDGQPVGILWLAHRKPDTPQAHAWIYNIEVLSERRGQGWGRALLEQAERITREWGLTSLQLHVFGANEVARNLYRSQGMREQSVVMTKSVG